MIEVSSDREPALPASRRRRGSGCRTTRDGAMAPPQSSASDIQLERKLAVCWAVGVVLGECKVARDRLTVPELAAMFREAQVQHQSGSPLSTSHTESLRAVRFAKF